ncbi:hypothetical protein P2318_05920 [Myxococcaceae bacterium GXIMD 01537]
MVRLPPVLPLLLLALASRAPAAEVDGSLRVTGRLMVDSNAPRDFSDGQTPDPLPDGAFNLLAAAEGRLTGESAQLVGRYEGGLRKYLTYTTEDMLVQSLALEGSVAVGPSLGLGVEGRAKDRRGGSRAYTDLGANAFVEYAPDARLALRLRAGAHRFVYRPSEAANFSGTEVGFTGRYRLNRRHAFTVSGDYGRRGYLIDARPRPEVTQGPGTREDGALAASAGYTYRGPVALGLSYGFQEVDSNSFGETALRHRLSASAGVRLPWRLTLLAQGTLGLSRYPDGIYLSPEIILLDEDEAQNTLSLKLARPVRETLDVELTYGLYHTRLPRNGLSYFRQALGVGLTWRL